MVNRQDVLQMEVQSVRESACFANCRQKRIDTNREGLDLLLKLSQRIRMGIPFLTRNILEFSILSYWDGNDLHFE